MKKIRSILLSFILIIMFPSAILAKSAPIPDVDRSFWAYRQINWCVDKGYMDLQDNGEFCPNQPILLGEAVSSMLRSENIEDSDFELVRNRFPLVVREKSDLDRQITREMACYILMSGEQYEKDSGKAVPTADADVISEEYYEYVSRAIDYGIFVPDDYKEIHPEGIVSRAVYAMMLSRACKIERSDIELIQVMAFALLITFIFALIAVYLRKKGTRLAVSRHNIFVVFLLIAVVLRIFVAIGYYGFNSDMNFWRRWSEELFHNGFYNIYSTSDVDYPPGYLYILYLLGGLNDKLHLGYFFYKLPAICFDVVWIMLVHRAASKRISDKNTLLAVDFMASFAPPLIIDSCLWGQVDIIYMVFMGMAVECIINKKMKQSYFWYATSVIFKPQALVLAPIILLGIYENVLKRRNAREILSNLCAGIGAILLMLCLAMPFNILDVVNQYMETLSSYPYFSVGAFNVYSMIGLDFQVLPGWYSAVNTAILVLIVVSSVYLFEKGSKSYYYCAGLISFEFFMFSTKVHERYCFPAVLMFLMAYIYDNSKENAACFMLSVLAFTANVLSVCLQEQTIFTNTHAVLSIISALNLVIMGYMIYVEMRRQNKKVLEVSKEIG